MKFLMRPQNEYLDQASLGELHRASRAWLSEIGFWQSEVRFLINLATKDMIAFVEKEEVPRATEVFATLKNWDKRDLPGMLELVQKHEKHLAALLENPFDPNTTAFRVEHGNIEVQISEFMHSYREMKEEIFRVEEEIMADQKGTPLLPG